MLQSSPSGLRLCPKNIWKEHGVSDDVLQRGGLTAGMAFTEIVNDMKESVCLCCCTVDPKKAEDVTSQIQKLVQYFNPKDFAKSSAYERLEMLLSSDLSSGSIKTIRALVSSSAGTRYYPLKVCAAANEVSGICMASPPCSSGRVLWVYSTSQCRKFLRCLAKYCKKENIGVKLGLAGAEDTPRFCLRMYSVHIDKKATFQHIDRFWTLVLNIAKTAPKK